MFAGIFTPKDKWHITRVSNLKYLADRWTPEEMGGNQVQVIVVRDKKLLEGSLTGGQKWSLRFACHNIRRHLREVFN